MRTVEVRTQVELDKAIKNQKPGDLVVCLGGTIFTPLVVSGSSRVEAWGSSRVVAWGSSRVVAWESSQVVARESSQVVARESSRVEARESSQVVARGSSRVEARESSRVEASKYVAIHRHDKRATVRGGVIIDVPDPHNMSPADWCDYYGVSVKRGTAIMFKALDDDYSTSYARRHDIFYTPGSKPKCDDWNGRPECGGGLHVSPSPNMARDYNEGATRYVAVPVKVAEMIVIDNKAKVPRVSGAVYEVDIYGEPLSS